MHAPSNSTCKECSTLVSYVQKPFLATLGKQSCPASFAIFGNLYALPDFFLPILAIHKVCQKWLNLPPKLVKNGNFEYYYRFAIIGNICNSSKKLLNDNYTCYSLEALVRILYTYDHFWQLCVWQNFAKLVCHKVELVKFFQN